MQWFVAHTLPQQEMIAHAHLQRQGFAVYLPRYKKIKKHARKVAEVLTPLFPRYLFVGIDLEKNAWRSVNGTRGISYLLTNNGAPTEVAASVVSALKAQETDGIVPVATLAAFVCGEKVRVTEGIFAGQIAVFEKMTDRDRVQLLLNLLGREMEIAVPFYAVEAI